MAYVTTVAPDAAQGELRPIYDAANKRAGRVYQILQVQSLNPKSLRASMQLYQATTTDPKGSLPRWVCEAIAAVTRQANSCNY